MWTKACKADAIEEGKGLTVYLNGRQVALFKSKGEIFAIDNVCPHQGGPLGEGCLDGEEVTCPWHAWAFNIKTGECQTALGTRQAVFKVKIENGDAFVEL